LPPSQIEWADVIGSPARLVVPLRVVRELDDKKATNTKPLRQRAEKRLHQLAGYTLGDGPHEVRSDIGIEVVGSLDLDHSAERRPPIPADVEVLDTCEALATYNGGSGVCLLTGDLGMQVPS
jgi:PIN domain